MFTRLFLALAAVILWGCSSNSSTSLFTVTASGTNTTIGPSTAQTVLSGAQQAFTVTGASGYLPATIVGGTCPAGSWSGNVYSTGAVTANCTVTFSANALAFSPTSGPVGTLVTVTGGNFSTVQSATAGGQSAIVVGASSSSLTLLVMPGSTSGEISLTTSQFSATSSSSFTVSASSVSATQQAKLVGTGATGNANQGYSVSLSADGNTALLGGYQDNSSAGAAWVFTRSSGTWAQQGSKLVGTGATGNAGQGYSVSLSADGNTALVGGYLDNSSAGAAWVFTRSSGTWSQQGSKLVGTGATGNTGQGYSVSLSADGNTALVGGYLDNSSAGATWVFTRSSGTWSQQGSKLVGTGATGNAGQGFSVSLSEDGNTALIGGWADNGSVGAAWVFTRSSGTWSQQGSKLVGTGALGAPSNQGTSVSLSADGNTALIGGPVDNSNVGAAWVFTRSSGTWSQQGKLVGTGASGPAKQGFSVSLSGDGNTALIGGYQDSGSLGAAWEFTRSSGTWSQQGSKLVGTGATGNACQGISTSLSGDASTALIGGQCDDIYAGAAWVFIP